MNAFIDTSALIKRYAVEAGSNTVDLLVEEEVEHLIVGPFTFLECTSGLRRLVEMKILSSEEYAAQKELVREDFRDLLIIPFTEKVETKAEELIDRFQLKTLDAIQAAALLAHNAPVDVFICADEKLCKVVAQLGLKVINPTKA